MFWQLEVLYPSFLCSIYSNSGHVGWLAGLLYIILEEHMLITS